MKLILIVLALFTGFTSTAQNNALTPVLNGYLKLKNEMVAGNNATVAAAAAEMKTTLATIDNKSLNADEVKAFEPLKQKLIADAVAIASANDIKQQRDLFSSLSNNMIALAKATALSAQEIYLDYCPMRKASWLSTEKAIRNPYYGKSMLTCGNVKETIKH